MKILPSRIKRWNFKKRLHEMEARLRTLQHDVSRAEKVNDTIVDREGNLDETLQILDYWIDHMEGEANPPVQKKKPKKPQNLW